MLSFKIPPPKKSKKDALASPVKCDDYDEYSWRREITIPVSKAILDQCAVGDPAALTLKGKVTRTESEETATDAKVKQMYELRIEVSEVMYEGKNEYEELSEDD